MSIWDKDKTAWLKENYPNNGSEYCSNYLGVSRSSVMHKAVRLGIRVTEERKKKAQLEAATSIKTSLCKVKASSFITELTPESVYLLGLMWADGSLNKKKNQIAVEMLDCDISNLHDVFSKTGSWTIFTRNRLGKNSTTYSCSNKELYTHLSNMNYEIKSGACASKIVDYIPEDLKHYWFRGFFDGDGCIYIKSSMYQISFAGCYNQEWNFLTNILDSLVGYNKITRRVSNIGNIDSSVRFTGKNKCLEFAKYIYPNLTYDGIGLKRKFDKFMICQ